MATPKQPAKSTIASVLATSLKKFDLHVGSLTSIAEDVKVISTGNIAIDNITGVNGMPLGRSIELFGPPSSGKTTTALQAAAELQRIIVSGGDPARGIAADDVMVYFDYEHAMDPVYVKKLGLDVDHPSFLFAQPDSLEQGANVARELIATGKVRMTIWDSVAAMTPQVKLDSETGRSLPAVQAKLMSEFLVAMNPLLHQNNCTALFLNHIMELMDMGGARRPGMPARTSTPGGRALKFYASMRVEYQQVQNIKSKTTDVITQEEIDEVSATNVRVRVIKNKVGPPFRQAVVRVRYGQGFDNFWTALQILIAHKQMVYSSGYFYFERSPDLAPEWMPRQTTGSKRPYIRSEENVFLAAAEHPDWRQRMIDTAASILAVDPNAVDAITLTVPAEPDPEEETPPDEDELPPAATTSAELDELLPPRPANDRTASLLADM